MQVYDLLNDLRQESIWGSIPIQPIQPYVVSQLLTVLHDPKQILLIADHGDGEFGAVCWAQIVSHDLMPGLTYLHEKALYVRPQYRGLGFGKAIWREAVRWGKEQDAYGYVYGKITMKRSKTMVEEVIWHVYEREAVHA